MHAGLPCCALLAWPTPCCLMYHGSISMRMRSEEGGWLTACRTGTAPAF